MRITMDGQYALRKDPYTPVTILSVDRCGGDYPVVALTCIGSILIRGSDGRVHKDGCINTGADLVPLKQKPKSIWVNEYDDYGCAHDSKEKAIEYANAFTLRVAVEYKEVVDEDQN